MTQTSTYTPGNLGELPSWYFNIGDAEARLRKVARDTDELRLFVQKDSSANTNEHSDMEQNISDLIDAEVWLDDNKLEVTDLIAGTDIQLVVSGRSVTINNLSSTNYGTLYADLQSEIARATARENQIEAVANNKLDEGEVLVSGDLIAYRDTTNHTIEIYGEWTSAITVAKNVVLADAKSYTDTQVTLGVNEAKSYADTLALGGGGGGNVDLTNYTTKTYVDTQDNSVLSDAKTYADTQDSSISSTITTAYKAADSTLQTNIDTETAARVSADSTLTSNLNNEISNRSAADSAIETAYKAADSTLQSNIDAETATRASQDSSLQSQIDALETAYKTADSTLQSNIDAETTARTSEDTTLENLITAESIIREAADTKISNALTSAAAEINDQVSTSVANIYSNIYLIWEQLSSNNITHSNVIVGRNKTSAQLNNILDCVGIDYDYTGTITSTGDISKGIYSRAWGDIFVNFWNQTSGQGILIPDISGGTTTASRKATLLYLSQNLADGFLEQTAVKGSLNSGLKFYSSSTFTSDYELHPVIIFDVYKARSTDAIQLRIYFYAATVLDVNNYVASSSSGFASATQTAADAYSAWQYEVANQSSATGFNTPSWNYTTVQIRPATSDTSMVYTGTPLTRACFGADGTVGIVGAYTDTGTGVSISGINTLYQLSSISSYKTTASATSNNYNP